MVNIYDYTLLENNCFIVKHIASDYVVACKIDDVEKQLTIEYSNLTNIPEVKSIIFEEYNKFGILVNSTDYTFTNIVCKTKNSITYSYQ